LQQPYFPIKHNIGKALDNDKITAQVISLASMAVELNLRSLSHEKSGD
jgi:hypothetical protein